MAQRTCPECGTKCDSKHKFCPECGLRLPLQQDKNAKPEAARPREKSRPKRKTQFHCGCFLLILLVMAGLGVAGYYGYQYKVAKDLENKAYADLGQTQDIERYYDFIARFPDSPKLARVKARLEVLKGEKEDFEALMRSGDGHRIRQYLIENGDTPRRAQIEAKLDTLEYHDALKEGTSAAMQRYVDTHPKSPYAEIAKAKVKELKLVEVSDMERSRAETMASRFVSAMNNGDSDQLNYILASNFHRFNESDTTLTSFNHDIMVYVNENLFCKNDTLNLRLEGDPAIQKIPHPGTDVVTFQLSFDFTVGRYDTLDEWQKEGATHNCSATLNGQYQFLTLKLK